MLTVNIDACRIHTDGWQLLPPHFQDVKPLSSIPLLGLSVEDSAVDLELQGQACFCLSQSSSTHTFSCDSLDLKQRWLAVLKVTVTGKMPACLLTDSNNISNGSGAGIDGNVSDTTGEELAINCTMEKHSWMFEVRHHVAYSHKLKCQHTKLKLQLLTAHLKKIDEI